MVSDVTSNTTRGHAAMIFRRSWLDERYRFALSSGAGNLQFSIKVNSVHVRATLSWARLLPIALNVRVLQTLPKTTLSEFMNLQLVSTPSPGNIPPPTPAPRATQQPRPPDS